MEIEKKIVIIFEMSIYIINENGNIISSYDAPDVIEDYKIENNGLKVKYSGITKKSEEREKALKRIGFGRTCNLAVM